eukprot:g55026.t1
MWSRSGICADISSWHSPYPKSVACESCVACGPVERLKERSYFRVKKEKQLEKKAATIISRSLRMITLG